MRDELFDILVRAIVLVTAIPVHEAAHAFVADRLGDPTARAMGRMSLNPVRHFDLLGSVSLLLIGIGWAKPVPINARNFDHPRAGMAISAAAGPAANLLMALLTMILAKAALFAGAGSRAAAVLYIVLLNMCLINISLAIFNLMPFPPFDGSRIYSAFLPQKLYFGVMKYEKYILIAVLALLWLGVLDGPLGFLNNALFRGLDVLTGWVDLLFGLGR
ncbi:site-2 protease family protein [Anaerofilum sp. BX8]|uniref:Site-2 protease family protein n=1 Tax=Anaerofilum hominis TaxID=2763016 RepID=A0A923IAM0_9FIRM|nr:site-2 protease family protein [Anaerofilum hominis]MBC5582164.1 site-2 protease family protein [Anaerofilum hominis]